MDQTVSQSANAASAPNHFRVFIIFCLGSMYVIVCLYASVHLTDHSTAGAEAVTGGATRGGGLNRPSQLSGRLKQLSPVEYGLLSEV